MNIPADVLSNAYDLYHQGQYLQAWARLKGFGPPGKWKGVKARLLGGRLAGNLGANRLALALHLAAGRAEPGDHEAQYYYVRALLSCRGPYPALQTLRRNPDLEGADAHRRSEWFALRSYLEALLRSFDTAEHWMERALEAGPDRPWVMLERAHVLELEDRYDEALEWAQRTLEKRPWYRPGLQTVCHLYTLLGRDREALDLLCQAAERLDSCSLDMQRAGVERELGMHREVLASLDRFEAHAPLMEKDVAKWLAARRCDAAILLGDRERAAREAPLTDSEFYRGIAENLKRPDVRDHRVMLPVGFVRQHANTCSPATLTALSRFWSMPAEHLAVADEICYDGTPAHSQRRWAETHGWVAREFTVDWESAVALLDRGIPFTLTTVDPGSAHLQAVIGYDALCRTFFVRDPYTRHYGVFVADELLRHYASTGPRGMVIVPRDRSVLLENVPLPEAELYDDLHALHLALEAHDRAAAVAASDRLRERVPGHRLDLHAQRALAAYDMHRPRLLELAGKMQEQYPDDANLQIARLQCLQDLKRREERLILLEGLSQKKDAPPLFLEEFARELSRDARTHARAEEVLRRILRIAWRSAGAYHTLADIVWNRQDFEEALELYRYAACIEDLNEARVVPYFLASRHLGRTETALRFLRNRFQRHGGRNAGPILTLISAYEQLEQSKTAFELLEEGLQRRSEDGELLLFAADMHARYGHHPEAAALLKDARGKAREAEVLKTTARLASYRGDLVMARDAWKKAAEAEPLDLDAQTSYAGLVAQTTGKRAALEHVKGLVARFPHHLALRRLLVEELRDNGDAGYEEEARRLVEAYPDDVWARREQASILAGRGEHDAALGELEHALRVDPVDAFTRSCVARVCLEQGDRERAGREAREATRLSIDCTSAARTLLASCPGVPERREALGFLKGELQRQTILGDALSVYRELASATLEPDELLATLREAQAARPDLVHAWSALTRQLVEMDRLEEAWTRAKEAAGRFPLVPLVWSDLARVCHLRNDGPGERTALGEAIKINPTWETVVLQLAEAYERADDLAEAERILEGACRRAPLVASFHGVLGANLRKQGRLEEAIARYRQAILLVPRYDWAWGELAYWAPRAGSPDMPVRLARDLVQKHAGDADVWLILSRILQGPENLDESLKAVDRCLELSPGNLEARDLRATTLAMAGRFDEAIRGCRWGDPQPLLLRGREAWVEAVRGNRKGAIERMEALVRSDPSYLWGWSCLADWHREEGTHDRYLEVAQELVRLGPHDAVARGYLADARLRCKDRAGAKHELRRAMELNPEHEFSGLALFDMEMEDGNLAGAGEILQRLKAHLGGELVREREVRWAVKSRTPEAARESLRALCLCIRDDAGPLIRAIEVMKQAGERTAAIRIVGEMLEAPDVSPTVAGVWAAQMVRGSEGVACLARLGKLQGRPEVWGRAASAWIEAWVDTHSGIGRGWRVGGFIRRNKERLRAHPSAWGSVGYAYVSLNRYGACVRWMSDWRERDGLRPWMLINLSLSLRCLGRHKEGAEVIRAALKLPLDGSFNQLRLWAALDAVVEGDLETAREALPEIDPDGLQPYYQVLLGLVRAGTEDYVAARRTLAGLSRILSETQWDTIIKSAFRSVVSRTAEKRGGFAAWCWGTWRSLFPG